MFFLIRRTFCPYLRRYLSDFLLAYAGNDYRIGVRNLEFYRIGLLESNGVGVTESKIECFTCFLCSVADTDYFKRLGIALRYADDHVFEQRAGKAVKRSVLFFVVGAFYVNNGAVLFKRHCRAKVADKRSLGALNGDLVVFLNVYRDAGGYDNGHSAYS